MIARLIFFLAPVFLLCQCETTPLGNGARVDVREARVGSSPSNAKRIPVSKLSKRYKELLEYQALPLTVYGSKTEIIRAQKILQRQGFQAVETKQWP